MLKVLFNHILPFLLGCLVGVAVFYIVTPVSGPEPPAVSFASGSGSGHGICKGREIRHEASTDSFEPAASSSSPFRILAKPRATYTDAAQQNDTEGTVLLKVTLLASGEVGVVTVIRGLPDGLTEQAIAAARRIEFEPKTVNGVPVSVTQTFEYRFDIY